MDLKREDIENLLNTNNRAVEKALVRLYFRQTGTEQEQGMTRDHNGVGFTPFDADFFTSLATQVLAGRHLSTKQIECVRRPWKKTTRIGKYANQLLDEARKKEQRKPLIVPRATVEDQTTLGL